MDAVQIVEVAPRDGFQSLTQLIPTVRKVEMITALHAAGVRRMEATSFVSPAAVPQLADASEVLAAAQALPGLKPQVLVPTARHGKRAIEAGARHLAFVLSVSGRHNLGNVGRTPAQSAEEFAKLAALVSPGMSLRLNLATAFDCPHVGRVPEEEALDLLAALIPLAPEMEVALCDTTGRATPEHVHRLFSVAGSKWPQVGSWALHAHDTFGLGAANAFAAWSAGVRVFDASAGGLGGCPFAPGATGNVATEDLVYMFNGMNVDCGIDLDRLIQVAEAMSALPGAETGGRVRAALAGTARKSVRSCRLDAAGPPRAAAAGLVDSGTGHD